MGAFENVTTVFYFVTGLFVVGQCISWSELFYLYLAKEFHEEGFFSWKVLRLDIPKFRVGGSGAIPDLLDYLFHGKRFRILLLIYLLAGIGLVVFHAYSAGFTCCAFLLLLAMIISQLRYVFGGEGSDQMNVILIFSLFAGFGFFSSHKMSEYAIFFIAGQSCLSYCSSGIAKLISAQWRKGDAVFNIFNTGSFGNARVSRFLVNRKRLCFFLSWSVIIAECLFPLSLVLPSRFILVFMIWGFCFHLLNAIVMGLNVFLWSYLATYPCIIYTAARIGWHLF
jgi:hypothetical protein